MSLMNSLNKLDKQTDLKEQRNFIFTVSCFCLYVADPATFLASNSVLGTLFSPENSFCTKLWTKYKWVCIITSLTL